MLYQQIKRNFLESCSPVADCLPRSSWEFKWLKATDPVPVECVVLLKGAVSSPKLTLTLPQKISSSEYYFCIFMFNLLLALPLDNDRKCDQTLSASTAVKLLHDAGYNFYSSFNSLLLQLELESDHKKMLHQQSKLSNDYFMVTEEAIDWWVKNKNSSLKKFIEVVSKCERNTANKIKEKLNET